MIAAASGSAADEPAVSLVPLIVQGRSSASDARESTPSERSRRPRAATRMALVAAKKNPPMRAPTVCCYSGLGQVARLSWTSGLCQTTTRAPTAMTSGTAGSALDVERDSDVPISTQIFWQLAYQIDSGRLLPGSRLPPGPRAGRRPAREPEHHPRRLPTPGRRGLRHEPPRRGHPRRRPATAAPRRRGPGRDRRRDAAAGRPRGLHRRRGRCRDVRRRHGAQAPRDRSSACSSRSARTPTPATTPSGWSTPSRA